jgi:triacylglycerol lipase
MNAAIQRCLLAFQLFCAFSIAFWLRKSGLVSSFALALALAIALAFLFQFALIGADFVLSRIHSGQSSSDQPPSTGSTIKAWLRESIDCIRVFSFIQVFFVNKPFPTLNPTTVNANKIPVLLLHGLFCNRGLWHGYAKMLTKQGHVVSGITMEPAFGSIDEYPAQIEQAIQALMKQTASKKVALIGHSMGGIAARSYCRQYGDRHVEKIITLGTPHQGTWISRFGHGINVKQMAIQSEWLQQLAKTESNALGKKITVILTDQDNIVFPQLVQTIPGATTIRVTGMGHISMVFDRKVQDIVRAVLA